MFNTYRPGISQGHQRPSDPPKLELHVLVYHRWVLGTELRSSAKLQVLLSVEPSLYSLFTF